jgi:hypothetical protein
VATGDSSIFRKAALERLASPERLDLRPGLPRYPRRLAGALVLLAAAVLVFAAWLK